MNAGQSNPQVDKFKRNFYNRGMTEKLLVSADEAAKMLSISRASLYAFVDRGLLPKPIKLGGRSLWSVQELRDWINSQRKP